MNADDIHAIQRLYAEYHHVIDDARWDDFTTIYTEDGVFDGTYYTLTGRDTIRDVFAQLDHPISHNMTNIVITPGEDDDSANVRSKFVTFRHSGTIGLGTYTDTVLRTPDGWRVKYRTARLRPGSVRADSSIDEQKLFEQFPHVKPGPQRYDPAFDPKPS
jgi:3-phenylpropionate/cinnamic acid dioxygenase small subunit